MTTPAPVLIERGGELTALEPAVDEALAGAGRVALVEGPAGIGKSALVAHARRRAEAAGARVLVGRGSELEREYPFGVVRQLLEGALAGATGDPWAGAAAAARPVFAPAEADAGPGGDGSFAVLHGLFWLTLNLAGDEPTAVVVDDLHWCDAPSLRFLAYLARRLEDLPVVLVTGLRTGERPTDPTLVAEITAEATVVRPGPLSPAATAELVRDRLGAGAHDAFCAACHGATAGNPLLLRQLLRALEAEGVPPDEAHAGRVAEIGPEAVSRTVLPRLARLPEPATEVARAVALLGERADLATVAALVGLDESAVARAAGDLARAEVLGEELPLAFVHPLVRDAVYREMPAAERALRHAAAAELLRDRGAEGDEVAAHLLQVPARGEAWVRDLLHGAGRAALQRGAADSGAAYLQRALDEGAGGAPPELLRDLGQAEALSSGAAATEHLRAAYEGFTDPLQRGLVAVGLSRTLLFLSQAEECRDVALRAIAELPDELDDVRLGLHAMRIAAVQWGAGSSADLVDLEPYRHPPVGPGPGARMLASAISYEWARNGGPAEGCAALALAANADDVLVAADEGLFGVVAIMVLGLADREEAVDVVDSCQAHSHRRGSFLGKIAVDLWRGWLALRRGELAEAEAPLRLSLARQAEWGMDEGATGFTRGSLATVLAERGDAPGALAALGDNAPEPAVESARFWHAGRLEALHAAGDAAGVIAAVDALLADPRAELDTRNPALSPWRSLKAAALDRQGRHDEALVLAAEELGPARQWGSPGAVGRSLRVLGTLEREAGLPRLEEAVAVLEGSPARLELAKALANLGAGRRRARQATEAREPLARALELAEACGAEALAARVRTELQAAGVRPRVVALGGVSALTASERRVAALAADGATNRDIAQALFVTPKTVEVHLSSAYRKLSIRSRRELAGALTAA